MTASGTHRRWALKFESMDGAEAVRLLSILVVIMAVCALFALQVVEAPYGRYDGLSKQLPFLFGWKVPGALAWVLFEGPNLVLAVWGYLTADPQVFRGPNQVLLGLFILHYIHRTLVFPLRQRQGKPWPVTVVALAFSFCCVNGFVQAYWLTRVAQFPSEYPNDPQFLFGVFLFFSGMYINMDADSILRNLRRNPEDTGYYIPRGGMFEYVSGANFFGEVVEWTGYAIAGNALPPLSFALFTACNLGPRALQHHAWYHKKFNGKEDTPAYPPDRKALIPGVI